MAHGDRTRCRMGRQEQLGSCHGQKCFAETLRMQGKAHDAEVILREVISILESMPPRPRQIAVRHRHPCFRAPRSGKNGRGEKLSARLLEMREKISGVASPELARKLIGRTDALSAEGKLDEALGAG